MSDEIFHSGLNQAEPMPIGAMSFGGQDSYARSAMVSVPTMSQRLELAVKQAEERLKAVTTAREIFNRNPDMEVLLNLMQKGLF